MLPTVALVLRSGGDFAPEHVARLVSGLRGRGGWGGAVVCLTDVPSLWPATIERRQLTCGWPGWWSKLELCAPEHDYLGDLLYLDLDSTIVGPIAQIAAVNRLTMLSDFLEPARLASGVMYLNVGARQVAWEQWQRGGPELIMRQLHRRGDQAFFEAVWSFLPRRWQELLPGQIVSYKLDVCQHGVDPRTRIVCFHGRPRPWEVPSCDVA